MREPSIFHIALFTDEHGLGLYGHVRSWRHEGNDPTAIAGDLADLLEPGDVLYLRRISGLDGSWAFRKTDDDLVPMMVSNLRNSIG